jgi:hypothetical protein
VGTLVVVVPEQDYYPDGINRIFVRTIHGRWKETQTDFRDIADALEPPDLTSALTSIRADDLRTTRDALGPDRNQMGPSCWLDAFSPGRGELTLIYSTATGGGQLLMRLSADGETWRLVGLEDRTPKAVR